MKACFLLRCFFSGSRRFFSGVRQVDPGIRVVKTRRASAIRCLVGVTQVALTCYERHGAGVVSGSPPSRIGVKETKIVIFNRCSTSNQSQQTGRPNKKSDLVLTRPLVAWERLELSTLRL